MLWCTYWIRFQRDGDTFAAAAQRCQKLFQLAKEAGVRRIVYTSHTHATASRLKPGVLRGLGMTVAGGTGPGPLLSCCHGK